MSGILKKIVEYLFRDKCVDIQNIWEYFLRYTLFNMAYEFIAALIMAASITAIYPGYFLAVLGICFVLFRIFGQKLFVVK